MRALAGWFEIANVAERLAELSGRPSGETFTARARWRPPGRGCGGRRRWPSCARCWPTRRGRTRAATPRQALEVGLRARWAQRVAGARRARARPGRPARSRCCSPASGSAPAGPRSSGAAASAAATLLGPRADAGDAGRAGQAAARRGCPGRSTACGRPADLWRAEAAWWTRTERDGQRAAGRVGIRPAASDRRGRRARRRCPAGRGRAGDRRPRRRADRECSMPWLETAFPVRMTRIALVAPAGSAAGDAGQGRRGGDRGDRRRDVRCRRGHREARARQPADSAAAGGPARAEPALSAEPPDLAELARRRPPRPDRRRGAAAAVRGGGGARALGRRAGRLDAGRPGRRPDRPLAGIGCAVVPLPRPQGRRRADPGGRVGGPARAEPAGLDLRHRPLRRHQPRLAGLGQLRADVRDDVRRRRRRAAADRRGRRAALPGWPRWARRYRRGVAVRRPGPGVAATAFGFGYGEFFGPTGVVPTLWLDPLASPIPLLLAGIGLGAVLLAGAYALGTLNRWREGGWPLALYAPSGIAGAAALRRHRRAGRRLVLPRRRAARSSAACSRSRRWSSPSPGSRPRPAAVASASRRHRSRCSTWWSG